MQDTSTTIKPRDVYEIVTNRIIEHLEKGVIPWRQPWTEAGPPKNLVTGRNYRGINVWLLNTLSYPQNYFLTFKQVKDLGGSVIKGEKGQEVIFWKRPENEKTGEDKGKDEDSEKEKKARIPLLRYYKVFNIDQCTGIPLEKLPPREERNNDPLETCEKIISEMPKRPDIRNNEHLAYYNKVKDFVNMPKMETFTSSESYYAALFHELVHSTGHKERLDRRELTQSKGYGTENYAIEELTAEMGASYLKSYSGIPIEQLENNVAYIQGWLEKLRNDKKLIVYAGSHAQRAADYILCEGMTMSNVRNEERELETDGQNEKEPEKSIEREMGLKVVRDKEKVEAIGIER